MFCMRPVLYIHLDRCQNKQSAYHQASAAGLDLRYIMSSSSSSSEEDLSIFQSVAVTADDIAESAKKEAEAVARKRSALNTGSAGQVKLQPAATVGGADDDAKPPQNNSEQLDLTSLKIAAALNSMLARQLEADTAPQPTLPPPAATGVDPAASLPAAEPSAAAAAASNDDDDDAAGVRLFKRVTPGTRCVITGSEYDNSNTAGADPSIAHHHPGMQQRTYLRDLIPRYSLALQSSNRSIAQHEQVLTALAVDGDALLTAAAAAAPGTAWLQQQQQGTKKKRKQGPVTAAAIAAWQSMRKRKVEGVVVDAKQFVSQDIRIAKLLGSTPS